PSDEVPDADGGVKLSAQTDEVPSNDIGVDVDHNAAAETFEEVVVPEGGFPQGPLREEDEPELPPPLGQRRDSVESNASTILHARSVGPDGLSSDIHDPDGPGSPELPRLRDPEEAFSSPAFSPPSSPPFPM